MYYPSPVLLLVLAASCAVERETVDNRIPLNLDYARASVVQPDRPWGWSLHRLGWVGVHASRTRLGLRLHRPHAGAPAQASHDLYWMLAGRRVGVAATVQTPAASAAAVRLGVTVLHADDRATTAWSPRSNNGTCVATAVVPADVQNVQIVVEYSGHGDASVSPVRLTVDGQPFDGATLPNQHGPDATAVGWVRDRAIPLRTTDPSARLDDLAALRPTIGNARFVMLGESTHGSSEFFTLRHRIIRYLTERQGFTVVVIEDHYGKAKAIDRYIQTGEGDVEALVGKLFAVWSRREMLAFVQWLRDATAAGRIRVTFAGCDLQVPFGAMNALRDFGRQHDPDLVSKLQLLEPMRNAWEAQSYPRRTPEEHTAWSRRAEDVLRFVRERSTAYRTRLGAVVANEAVHNARLIWQSAEVSRTGDMRLRDRFMAQNLSWIADRHPGARVAVWAHNTHVRFDEGAMGEHLARMHPNQAVSFGIATYRGSYAAWDPVARRMQTYALFPGPPDSIENLLHSSRLRIFALDLRRAREAAAAEWLRTPHLHRNIGLFAADLGFYRATMTDGFTALLFVDRTSATQPLR